jgi:TonB family protein
MATVSYAQIDCEKFYKETNSETFSGYSEKPPTLVGGFDQLFVADSSISGKVIVQVIVNLEGNAECVRVLKSDNEELNNRAIKLVRQMNFKPAKQKGKPVVSTLILPIVFGQTELDKKSKSRKEYVKRGD